jgi:RNA polymerase sigma-70 factor (ECF subfamily)
MTDEELFALSFSQPKLFEVIVERYEEAFLRKARAIVRDEEVAKDIVQDAFVKMYLYGKGYKPQTGARWSSWAYKILINTCFAYHQKLKKDKEFSTSFSEELEAVTPDESAHETLKGDREYVLSLVDRLPETFARILRLYVVDGKDYADIAMAEDVSVGAVKTRIHRAKAELKKIAEKITY